MENNFDNTPDNSGNANGMQNPNPAQGQSGGSYSDNPSSGQQTYVDPNAGYQQAGQNSYNYYQDNNYQSNGYQQPNQNMNRSQDNYYYNQGNNAGYNQPYNSGMDERPLTMGEWFLTLLVAIVPCVGIIMYFVWAFSKTGNINRRNFCRAHLIITGISLVLVIIYLVFIGTLIGTQIGSGSFNYSYY